MCNLLRQSLGLCNTSQLTRAQLPLNKAKDGQTLEHLTPQATQLPLSHSQTLLTLAQALHPRQTLPSLSPQPWTAPSLSVCMRIEHDNWRRRKSLTQCNAEKSAADEADEEC